MPGSPGCRCCHQSSKFPNFSPLPSIILKQVEHLNLEKIHVPREASTHMQILHPGDIQEWRFSECRCLRDATHLLSSKGTCRFSTALSIISAGAKGVSHCTPQLFSQAVGQLTDKQRWLRVCLPLKDRHGYLEYFPNLIFSCKRLLAKSGLLLHGGFRGGTWGWDTARRAPTSSREVPTHTAGTPLPASSPGWVPHLAL